MELSLLKYHLNVGEPTVDDVAVTGSESVLHIVTCVAVVLSNAIDGALGTGNTSTAIVFEVSVQPSV